MGPMKSPKISEIFLEKMSIRNTQILTFLLRAKKHECSLAY